MDRNSQASDAAFRADAGVRTFEEAVARVLSGFEVLLHRAAGQVHQVTGLLVPIEQMRAARRAAIESR